MAIVGTDVVTVHGAPRDHYVSVPDDDEDRFHLPPGGIYLTTREETLVEYVEGGDRRKMRQILFLVVQGERAILLGYVRDSEFKNTHTVFRRDIATVNPVPTSVGPTPVHCLVLCGNGLLTPSTADWTRQWKTLTIAQVSAMLRRIPRGVTRLRACAPGLARAVAAHRIRGSYRKHRAS